MATHVEKRLTAIKIDSIKKSGFHADGGGLYLRAELGDPNLRHCASQFGERRERSVLARYTT